MAEGAKAAATKPAAAPPPVAAKEPSVPSLTPNLRRDRGRRRRWLCGGGFRAPSAPFTRHDDRLEHRDDLGALVLEPGRQQQVRSESSRTVRPSGSRLRPSPRIRSGCQPETAVDRVEVFAILDFGAVGVAELLVEILLLGQRFVGPTSSAM